MTGSLLALVAALLAPPSVADLSPLESQTADFWGAIGGTVAVRWVAEITPSGDITASLVVSGAVNPPELRRPAIEFPADAFQVLDAESPPRPLPGGAVAFDTRVRLRRAGAAELPAVPYAYSRPDRPAGKRFLTAYADPLVVAGRVEVPSPVAEVAPRPVVVVPLRSISSRVPAWAWLAPVAVTGPLAVSLRRVVAARAARQMRATHPAAATARRRLADAAIRANPAAIRVAILDYLAARRGLDAVARTPGEVEAALPPTPAHADLVAALRHCDAVRFSPYGDNGVALADDADAAVARCEGES